MRSIIVLSVFILFLGGCVSNGDPKKEYKNDTINSSVGQLLKKANAAYESDKYPTAKAYFDTLIEIDSFKGEYYFKRGYSEGIMLEKGKAISDFKKSILLGFKLPSSFFNIGINYSYYNDSLALFYLEKCIEADPSYRDAYTQLIDCKTRIRKHLANFNKDTLFSK